MIKLGNPVRVNVSWHGATAFVPGDNCDSLHWLDNGILVRGPQVETGRNGVPQKLPYARDLVICHDGRIVEVARVGKPERCPVCGAEFDTKQGLSGHVRYKHSEHWEQNGAS